MASADQIRTQLQEYLAGSRDLDDFEDWFLANNWDAHLHSDEDVVRIVHHIEGVLLDFSSDAITEGKLREELTKIARPFVDTEAVVLKPCLIAESLGDIDSGATRKPPLVEQTDGSVEDLAYQA